MLCCPWCTVTSLFRCWEKLSLMHEKLRFCDIFFSTNTNTARFQLPFPPKHDSFGVYSREKSGFIWKSKRCINIKLNYLQTEAQKRPLNEVHDWMSLTLKWIDHNKVFAVPNSSHDSNAAVCVQKHFRDFQSWINVSCFYTSRCEGKGTKSSQRFTLHVAHDERAFTKVLPQI